MQWHGVGLSDVGRQRDHNEDAHHEDDELGLYIVADGMGGHAAGEIASQQAVQSITTRIGDEVASVDSRQAAQSLIRSAMLDACRDIYALARSDKDKAGMGTTVTLAWLFKGHAIIGHVGDSRAYLYRNDYVSQLTSDHTIRAELKRSGRLAPDQKVRGKVANSLTRAVGTQAAVEVDVFSVPLVSGDVLLLCSDGLANYVESTSWLAEQIDPAALEGTAEELIEHANEAGGRDNITAVLVGVAAEEDHEERAQRRKTEVNAGLRALASVFLFKDLKLGLMSRLLGHCKVRRLKEKEQLVEQGTELRSLMVVVEGSLAVERDGREVARLRSGDFAGTTSLCQPRTARACLRAAESTRVLILERSAFFRLVRSRPLLGINMLERMTAELSRELDRSVGLRDDGDPATSHLYAAEQL